jgi:hypothetical protein
LSDLEETLLGLLSEVEEQLDAAARWQADFAAWELEYLADSLQEYFTLADEAVGADALCAEHPSLLPAIEGFRTGQRRALEAIRALAAQPDELEVTGDGRALDRTRAAVETARRIQYLKEEHLRRVRERMRA